MLILGGIMSLDEVRALLTQNSPAVSSFIITILVIWTFAAAQIRWVKGPGFKSSLWLVANAIIAGFLWTAGFSKVAVLAPWASAAGSTVMAYCLIKGLGRARRATTDGYYAVAAFGGSTYVNDSVEQLTMVADPNLPVTLAEPYDANTYLDSTLIDVSGQICMEKALAFRKDCRDIGSGRVVTVTVSCDGGDVNAARTMHTALCLLDQCNQVFVLVAGNCSSAAVPFIMAVPVQRRIAGRNSQFMFHPSSGGSSNGRAHIDRHWAGETVLSGTRIDPESMQKVLSPGKESYLTAQEALNLGIVSAIF
jgi:ATP-dependent protease ClpP protease subunit